MPQTRPFHQKLMRVLLRLAAPLLAAGCSELLDNPDCGGQGTLYYQAAAAQDFNSAELPRESEIVAGGKRTFRWTTDVIDHVCPLEHVFASFTVKVNAQELRPDGFAAAGEINHYLQQSYDVPLLFNGGPRQWEGTVSGGINDIDWVQAHISPQYWVRLTITMVSHGSEAADWAILKPYLDNINVSTTYNREKTSSSSLLGR